MYSIYKVHKDANLLQLDSNSPEYIYNGESIPQVNASASIDSENKIHISLCNMNPNEAADINCKLRGGKYSYVNGTVVTAGAMNQHNTFENNNNVKPQVFNGATLKDGTLSILMPPMSVVVLTVD